MGSGQTNLYSYVGGDPVNLRDPSGLAPGDKFPAKCGAAIDARDYMSDLKDVDIYEYGAIIYREPDGTYGYSVPVTDWKADRVKIDGEIPYPADIVGDIHNHPSINFNDPSAYKFGTKFDVPAYRGLEKQFPGYTGYLITPDSRIRSTRGTCP